MKTSDKVLIGLAIFMFLFLGAGTYTMNKTGTFLCFDPSIGTHPAGAFIAMFMVGVLAILMALCPYKNPNS